MPRLRIFAGPNGSGKSSLFEKFSENYDTGIFLNADLIENELSQKGYLDISEYDLNLTQENLEDFLLSSDSAKTLVEKAAANGHLINVQIKNNVLIENSFRTNGYEGALISAFLRSHLVKENLDFSFETVMSHKGKIKEAKDAKQSGYKIYLYFICIDDPEVNISRVENRVKKGGHNVMPEKIASRYLQTLENLIEMIEVSDKCYLFDNSGQELKLLAKIINDQLELMIDTEQCPNWFNKFVLKYY